MGTTSVCSIQLDRLEAVSSIFIIHLKCVLPHTTSFFFFFLFFLSWHFLSFELRILITSMAMVSSRFSLATIHCLSVESSVNLIFRFEKCLLVFLFVWVFFCFVCLFCLFVGMFLFGFFAFFLFVFFCFDFVCFVFGFCLFFVVFCVLYLFVCMFFILSVSLFALLIYPQICITDL